MLKPLAIIYICFSYCSNLALYGVKLCEWKHTDLDLLHPPVDWHFYHYEIVFSLVVLALNSTLSDVIVTIAIPASFLLVFLWEIFFPTFAFNYFESLVLVCVSCRWYSRYCTCCIRVPLDHFTISVLASLSSNPQHLHLLWRAALRLRHPLCPDTGVRKYLGINIPQRQSLTNDWQVWECEYLRSLELW